MIIKEKQILFNRRKIELHNELIDSFDRTSFRIYLSVYRVVYIVMRESRFSGLSNEIRASVVHYINGKVSIVPLSSFERLQIAESILEEL